MGKSVLSSLVAILLQALLIVGAILLAFILAIFDLANKS